MSDVGAAVARVGRATGSVAAHVRGGLPCVVCGGTVDRVFHAANGGRHALCFPSAPSVLPGRGSLLRSRGRLVACFDCTTAWAEFAGGPEASAAYLLLPLGVWSCQDTANRCEPHAEDWQYGRKPRVMMWRDEIMVGCA